MHKKMWLCGLAATAMILLDQVVKHWVTTHLALGETAEFLPPLVALHRVHNYGAAWSSFSGARWLLVGVTAVGLAVLCWLLARAVWHPLGVWSLTAIIGGGLGNLLDRVRLGYVVDMFDVMFMDFPVFNVADCFVVCGTIVGAVYYLWFYEKFDAGRSAGHGADSPNGN